jgi:hypothetical protein
LGPYTKLSTIFKKKIHKLSLLGFLSISFLGNAFAADSLSYSGRLVNTNGSPVAGPVNLKVELSYTSAPSTILCFQNISNVALSNGVFHLKVDLDCGTDSLSEVLAAVPAGEAASLRVTDLSHSKTYAFQAIHAVPFSNTSDITKQIVQMGATNGQVLQWNNTSKKWEPGTITVTGGTVTNVSVNAPLTITNPASTPSITLPQANTTTNGYLSSADWNTFNNKQPLISAGVNTQYFRGDKSWQTLDTSIVPENVNLYFTNARALGVPLTGFSASSGAITATDSVLSAFEKTQGQINSIGTASNNYLLKNSSDSITGSVNVSITGALTITNPPALPTDAANRQYVNTYADTKLSLTGGTLSGDLNLDTQLKLKGATNYVTVKAHATSNTYNFILPQTAGTSGYVLQTDGSGNTNWVSPSVGSSNITDGSIVDADVNASAAIAQSKIAGLTTDLSTINSSITGINSSLSGLTTTSVAEGTNKYYLDSRAIAAPLTGFVAGTDTAIVAADTTLQAFDKTQGQINNRVKKNGDTMSGILTLDSDLKIKGGSNYVTLRGHATSANYNFIFPSSAGSTGQVLQTDGSGNLSWSTPSTTATPSGAAGGGLSGTYPNPTIASGLDAVKLSGGAVTNAEFDFLDGVTSSIQTQLNNKQGLDATLTSLAGYNSTGFLVQTAADTFTGRSLAGTTNRVNVTNGNGVSANPTIDIASALLPSPLAGDAGKVLKATGADAASWTALDSADVTSALTFTPVNKVGDSMTGDLILNTKLRLKDSAANYVELKSPATVTTTYTLTFPAAKASVAGQMLTSDTSGNLSWTTPSTTATPSGAAGGGLAGTYPNPTIASNLDAVKLSGGTVTNTEFDYLDGVTSSIQTQFSGKQPLDTGLTNLSSYNTNGILVQTANDTFAGRSIAGTANRITVTNGDGVSANPTINVDSNLLPSPSASGSWLKSTGANTSAWTAMGLSDITGALGYTPINKAGDTIAAGTFTYNGAALLRTLDPIGPTDVVTKQYVDGFGQWTKSGSDIYRASGNVGVGTTTPGYKLTVAGAISGGDATAANSDGSLTPVLHSFLGSTADPSVAYVLLAYNQTAGSGISSTGFDGQINVYRGSAGSYNSGTLYDVAVRTVYSGPTVYRYNISGTQTGSQLVTLTYNTKSYIALQTPASSAHDVFITGRFWTFRPILLDSTTHAGQITAIAAYASPLIATTAAGNVGVGTSTPAAKLEVAGGIKLGSMTACTGTEEGSQRYNSTLKIMEFCDGVAWQSFAGSAATPTGAVMAFDLSTCPTGWTEYTAARGRFLRGINGSGVDPAGNRSPGSLQAEDWRGFSMTNTIQGGSSGYSHGPVDMGKSTSTYTGNLFVGMWSTPMAALGTKWNTTDETRPINVGVLYCRKN